MRYKLRIFCIIQPRSITYKSTILIRRNQETHIHDVVRALGEQRDSVLQLAGVNARGVTRDRWWE